VRLPARNNKQKEKIMDFYTSIAQYYDKIFPLQPPQLSLCLELAGIENSPFIIDIGCATGSLAAALGAAGAEVWGIDPNAEMIKIAQSKNSGGRASFSCSLLDDFAPKHGQFSLAVCVGNTIAHISPHKMPEFIAAAAKLVSKGGYLLLQSINYGYILSSSVKELPLIDNENLRFERSYRIKTGSIEFNTRLYVKSNGYEAANSSKLYPHTAQEIKAAAASAGMQVSAEYADFSKNKFQPESLQHVIACRKL
jgi:glycine/sarcosine N-methyltransferase